MRGLRGARWHDEMRDCKIMCSAPGPFFPSGVLLLFFFPLGFLSTWFFIWCVWVHFDFGSGFDYGFSFCAGEYLFLGLFFWDEDMMDGWMRVRRY
jgi:hypothetical protein